MKHRLRAASTVFFAVFFGACTGQILDGAPDRRAARSPASRGSELHGRIERHEGLRLLRLWLPPPLLPLLLLRRFGLGGGGHHRVLLAAARRPLLP